MVLLGFFDIVDNFVENLVLGRFLLVIWLWKKWGEWIVGLDGWFFGLKMGYFRGDFCSQCLVGSPRGKLRKS